MCAAILAHSGWVNLPLPSLSFLYYSALIGGILLSWRFHASRILLGLLVLFLAGQAANLSGAMHAIPGSQGWTVLLALGVLVPVDFVVIALTEEHGFTVSGIVPLALFLLVQALVVTVLAGSTGPVAVHLHRGFQPSLPGSIWDISVAAEILLFGRTLFTNKPSDSAFLWALSGFLLSMQFRSDAGISTTYSVVSVLIIGSSVIETSYLLAYRDELTTLPSRRAFNDALSRLQDPYSIAVVDIDHFKRFNDTYGHDVGDQVLRLVAGKLARVSGGGQAYRCGGEEFAILFPRKVLSEVTDHLDRLRSAIENAEFHVRGMERRRTPRGPERRVTRRRNRPRKGDAIRRLAHSKEAVPLSVTVSIGIADSSGPAAGRDAVLQAADKALYRAKENGRNRVEVAASRRRSPVKSTGVA